MRDFWLGVESGGSKTRILAADSEGNIIAREQCAGASRLYLNVEAFRETAGRIFHGIARQTASRQGRMTMAGLAGPMDDTLVETLIAEIFGDIRVLHFSEADLALAVHDLSVGVSIVAGTGSSARSIDEQGQVVCVGGYGPQFDDEGSGYWIGREAITAVARAMDGRGPQTQLHERMLRYFGLRDVWALHDQCDRNGHIFVPRVAAFANEVFEAARHGDTVSRRICARAGKALAELALAAVTPSAIAVRPIPVALSGGVFHGGALILDALSETLAASEPAFTLYPPIIEPAEGLFRLMARDHSEGPNRVRE